MTQTAFVTGASSGIGRAAALALRARGFRVVANVRDPKVAETLGREGFETAIFDMRNETAMAAQVRAVEQRGGGIDVLVNSAGYGLMGPMEEISVQAVRDEFEVNVFGLLRLSQLVLPAMRSRRSGRVIHIGSCGGLFTAPGAGAYHMSKYALEALSDAMRAEVSGFGVHVALIEPTGVRTDFVHKQVETMPHDAGDAAYDEFKAAMAKSAVALFAQGSRAVVTPEAVAAAVVHAATARRPRSRYPVGAVARVLPVVRRLMSDRRWDGFMLAQLGAIPGAGAQRHSRS